MTRRSLYGRARLLWACNQPMALLRMSAPPEVRLTSMICCNKRKESIALIIEKKIATKKATVSANKTQLLAIDQLICQHWHSWCPGAGSVPGHQLCQCWSLILMYKDGTGRQWVKEIYLHLQVTRTSLIKSQWLLCNVSPKTYRNKIVIVKKICVPLRSNDSKLRWKKKW